MPCERLSVRGMASRLIRGHIQASERGHRVRIQQRPEQADDDLALVEHLRLVRSGAMDAQDHVAGRVEGRGVDDLRARLDVALIRERGRGPGATLDEHDHARFPELLDRVGDQRDAPLFRSDLSGYANFHGGTPAARILDRPAQGRSVQRGRARQSSPARRAVPRRLAAALPSDREAVRGRRSMESSGRHRNLARQSHISHFRATGTVRCLARSTPRPHLDSFEDALWSHFNEGV